MLAFHAADVQQLSTLRNPPYCVFDLLVVQAPRQHSEHDLEGRDSLIQRMQETQHVHTFSRRLHY